MEQKVLSERMYAETEKGVSVVWGDPVTIIGERTVELPNKVVVEQYLYTMDNYEPENGQPFVALKANISLI